MGRREFMLAQLEANDILYKLRNRDIRLKCPFHHHSGRKFKLSIHEMGRPMHCWVCKKKGTWNDYAKLVGLEELDFRTGRTIDDFLEVERQLVAKDPSRIQLPRGIELWDGPMPRHGKGPDIPEDVLEEIPSFRWYDAQSKSYRILFDVTVHRRRVGWIGYSIDDTTFPKVKNMPGEWSSKALFPFDHILVRGSPVIVLVEGPTDALRFLSEGIPAVSILGVGSWTESTCHLVAAHGAECVLVVMDGDEEGRKAARKIALDCRCFSKVVKIYLPGGMDPANVAYNIVKKIRIRVKKEAKLAA